MAGQIRTRRTTWPRRSMQRGLLLNMADCSLPVPPSGLLFFVEFRFAKTGGSEDPPLHSVEMALAALLSCIIPLHFGLLTVGLGRRRFISGKRRGGEGNRNTQRNDHRNEALHGCFSVYCACPRLATAEPRSRKGRLEC